MKCFIIGRFQPLHIGHHAYINYALSKYDQVVIFIGSSDKYDTHENPFTANQRRKIIEINYPKSNIIIDELPDTDCDYAWMDRLLSNPNIDHESVFLYSDSNDATAEMNKKIIAHCNFKSEQYTNPITDLHASDIRHQLFVDRTEDDIRNIDGISAETADLLELYIEGLTFTKVYQTEYGDIGNCLSACTAFILGKSINEVPNFNISMDGQYASEDQFWYNFTAYLHLVGYTWTLYQPEHDITSIPYCIGVIDEDDEHHAVVLRYGKFYYDPAGPDIKSVDYDKIIHFIILYATNL